MTMTVFLRMLAEVLVKPLSQILWVALVGFLTQHWLLAFYQCSGRSDHVGILSRVLLSQFDWSVLLQLHVGDKVGRDRPTEGEDGRHHHLGENVDEDGVNVDVLFIETYIGWVNIIITTATVEPALATMLPIHRERMNWKCSSIKHYHSHDEWKTAGSYLSEKNHARDNGDVSPNAAHLGYC